MAGEADTKTYGAAAESPASASAAEDRLRPVVFACDENYAPYLPVVLQSLMDNASAAYQYEIIIMDCCSDAHSKIFTEMSADVRGMLAEKTNFSLKMLRVRNALAENAALRDNEQALKRYGYGTYARILIPDLLAEYNKILYLDVDHIILSDVAQLFDFPLGDKLIAAVPDINVAHIRLLARAERKSLVEDRLGLESDNYYVIASPMLFNVQACRDFLFTEKVLAVLSREADLPFPDQDAINSVCRGRIMYLPQKWGRVNSRNFTKICATIEEMGAEGQARAILGDWQAEMDDPAIVHYVTAPKPWSGITPDYSGLWWQYAARTKKSTNLLFHLLFPLVAPRGQGYFSVTYKILGLPFLTIKTFPQEKYCFLWKIPLFHTKYGRENCYIYILGLKIFTVRKKESWEIF